MISKVTQKGIEAQLRAELRANELGYIVSKPTTECCRYDMIIDDGMSLKRIQVKYCDHAPADADGSVHVEFRKCSNNGKERPCYTEKEVDAVVVFVAPIKRFCYIPIDVVANKTSINLRYQSPKNGQRAGVYMCKDYYW